MKKRARSTANALPAAAYADDLAYVHHTGFADLARGAAPFLVDLVGDRAGPVVDLGCGSGVVLRALLDAGRADVVGVDLSPAMLALAKKTAPRARFFEGSLYEAPLPKACAAVFAVGEPLSYGRAPLAPFFKRVHRALAERGLFVFDVIVEGEEPLTRRSWMAGEDWTVLVDTVEDRARLRLTRAITTFRRRGVRRREQARDRDELWRRTHEVHAVRVLRVHALLRMLRHAGFDVAVRTSYGAHPLAVRRRAFVCRKRAAR